jgi:hypothetical protein
MTTLIFIENVLGSGQAVKLTEDFGDYSVVRDLRPGEHARLVVSLFKTITVEEVALGGRLVAATATIANLPGPSVLERRFG